MSRTSGVITVLPKREKAYYPKLTIEERGLISDARAEKKRVLVEKPLYDIIEEYSEEGGPIPKEELKEIGLITSRGVARTAFLNLVGLFEAGKLEIAYVDFALVYTWVETKGEEKIYYQIRRNVSIIRDDIKGMSGIRFTGRSTFRLRGRPPKKVQDYIGRGAITKEKKKVVRRIEGHFESKARLDKYDERFKRKLYSILMELIDNSDYDFMLTQENDAEDTDDIPRGEPTSWKREKVVPKPPEPIEARWEIYDHEYDVLRRSKEARLPYGWEDMTVGEVVREFR